MLNYSKKISSRSSFYRLIAATLTMGGVSLLMPLIASAQTATAAGTSITNRATGTYEDPNNPGVPINATSNQVTATVAEVAGVTNVSAGLIDVNGGSVTTADVLNYNFLITNVGNDVTAFNIPGTASVVGANQGTVTVTAINGITLTTPINVAAGGVFTDNPAFITAVQSDTAYTAAVAVGTVPAYNGTILPNSTIRVQVPVTVTATVAGSPVSVQLGNVAPNDNSAATQNVTQSNTAAAPLANDVYTINPAAGQAGAPVNGVREAAAFTTVPLATAVNNLALATVLNTQVAYNALTASLTDDLLTYRLDLRVESTPPAGTTGITPAPLLPTNITLGGVANTPRILISDAIPANTTLDTSFVSPLTVTIGGVLWTRVYSTVATTTGPLAAAQNWQTGAFAGVVTRIGYITNGPLPAGTTTVADATGFQFRVITTGVSALPVTIANIAQVFGQTTALPISATNPLVYDESGDQNPNNYDGSVAPAPITTPATSPNGVAVPATDGTDASNNNSGTGPGGEDNVFTINPVGIILNGPPGQPNATGPDGTTQTDFVNKSTNVPAGLAGAPGSIYDPNAITFVNTVQNPATNTAQLDNVTLEPITAVQAGVATGSGTASFELTSLQNGAPLIAGTTPANSTVVTIAYPVGSTPAGTGRTATYRLDSGTSKFVLISSTTNGVVDGTLTPVRIASLAIGVSQNYNVTIDLPAGSVVTTGYSVPVVAYVDSDTTALTNGFKSVNADTPFNIKMDRVYTGYLSLLKASRVLQGTGLAVGGDQGLFTGVNPKTPSPGNIIEYQITYKNISTAASGSGNVILNANNIVITEDGAVSSNNWATFTLNVASSAADATAGAVITYFNGVTATTTTDVNVTRYLDSISTIVPNASGILTFQRVVK